MLLKNYDCDTAEDFEGEAIRFDLPGMTKVSIAPSHKSQECGICHSSYIQMMIPNIAIQVQRTQG